MLRRLQDFNDALQERVDEATAELRLRNEELVDSYQRVFALREALARAEQMAAVGQMAASVAHQVGTPLNLISGYVQMLQEDARRRIRGLRGGCEIVQEQIAKVARSSAPCSITRGGRTARRRQSSACCCRASPTSPRPKLDASGIALTLDRSRRSCRRSGRTPRSSSSRC